MLAIRLTRPGALALAALSLLPEQARGQSAGDPVHVDYQAPARCPDERAFLRRVRARIPGLRSPTADEAPRVFRIRVVEDEGRFLGSLTITEPDGAVSDRSIPAESCAEAVDALALVAALAIDPRALSARPVEVKGVEPPKPAPKPAGPQPVEPEASEMTWSAELGAGLHGASGVSPEPVLAWSASAGLGFTASGLVDPMLRGGVAWSPERTFDGQQGAATFEWISALVDLCVLEFDLGTNGSVRPCLTLELGEVRARGVRVESPNNATRTWAATGGLVEGAWRFSGPLQLVGSAAAVLPLQRDRYWVATELIHEVPLVAARVGLGLALRWP